jgi:hypothetical protein
MSANASLSLTEPQERKLTVTLAELERRLAALREALDRPSDDLRLTRYQDRVRVDEAAPLRQSIDAAQNRLRQMADALGLTGSTESERRSFVAGLELVSISLYEARPSGEMRGCGQLAPATAAFLEKEVPQLEALLRKVIQGLEGGAQRKGVGQQRQEA